MEVSSRLHTEKHFYEERSKSQLCMKPCPRSSDRSAGKSRNRCILSHFRMPLFLLRALVHQGRQTGLKAARQQSNSPSIGNSRAFHSSDEMPGGPERMEGWRGNGSSKVPEEEGHASAAV